jgi:hypothetical protein
VGSQYEAATVGRAEILPKPSPLLVPGATTGRGFISADCPRISQLIWNNLPKIAILRLPKNAIQARIRTPWQ